MKNDTDGVKLSHHSLEQNLMNGHSSGGKVPLMRDHVFNKATATIKIETEDGEVKVLKDDEATARQKERNMLYGGFVKAG
jgi:hypothetical protein